jgi:phosphoglycerate dehydrogenase-like enzyme
MEILVAVPADVTRDTFFTPKVRKILDSFGNIRWNEKRRAFSDDEMRKLIVNTDILITGWNVKSISKEIIDNAKKLKMIAHVAGSVGGLIDGCAYEKGIRVISANWIFAESVAEAIICYSLIALRKIPYYMTKMMDQGWKDDHDINEGLFDRKIGIIGFGAVGRNLVSLLRPFRPEIFVFDPYTEDDILLSYGVKRTSIDNIFSDSKIITIHVPQIPETFHMIGSVLLEKISDDAVFINTSRGSVIDETQLEAELKKNRFSAVLDVFEKEPLPLDSKLRKLPNVYLIPHMAGPTAERREAAALGVLEDIKNFIEGYPLRYEIKKEYADRMTR